MEEPLLTHPLVFAAIWQRSPDAMVVTDAQGIVLAANAAYFRLSGYSPDAIVGHSVAILVPPAERAQVVDAYQRSFASPQPIPVDESRIRRADGTERVVESHSEFLRTDGRRVAMVSILRDITERTRTAAALAEQARLLDLSNDAIIVRDVHNRIIYWNRGATDVYGWTRDEAVGQDLHTLLQTEFEAPLEQLLILLHQQDRLEGEVVQVTKDGRRITALCRWALDRDAQGRPGAILTTYNDITARKAAAVERERLLAATEQAREAAEAALTTREQFLAIASHELRTPLTVLIGYAYLLPRAMGKGTDAADTAVGHVMRQAERLNRLIGQLLDVARLQRGLFALDRQRLDLTAVVAQAVEAVQTLAQASARHQFVLEHMDDPVWVVGDGPRLEQALLNLLSNATKYSPPGSRITVRLARAAGQAVVSVTDQGIGMSAGDQGRVGEPFYRATNVGVGTSGFGLGLYVVREIVTRHDGHVDVESTEGQGTTVRVLLPLLLGAPAAPS